MKFFLSCLFISLISSSQSLNYDYSVTFGNHVIAINEINYDFQEGDLIGCFFINQNGQLQCCGSTVYNNEEVVYLSAWPDDFLTENQEGFYEGDEMVLGLYLCDNNEYISFSYNSFSPFNIIHTDIFYTSNGINQIDVNVPLNPDCINLSIKSQENDKKKVKVINYLGQVFEKNNTNYPYFIFFDDGSVEKKLIIR